MTCTMSTFIKHVYICVFLSVFWIFIVKSMKVIPERAMVTYLNPMYVGNSSINIRRYGRKSAYYINVKSTFFHTWTNNVTMEVSVKQYLHNEYRNSFVTMKWKFCDLIQHEPYFGRMLSAAGMTCPALAGDQSFSNMTVRTEDFPNMFPFEKGRGDVTFSITDTGEVLIKGQVEASFKQKLTGK